MGAFFKGMEKVTSIRAEDLVDSCNFPKATFKYKKFIFSEIINETFQL